MSRVVITGAGAVTALGEDIPSYNKALRDNTSGIGPLSCRDLDRLSIRIGAEVRGYDPSAHFPAASLPRLDRACQFAIVAAREA
ncbi:MAG: beta-ketoacyl synthase N-terminal-like domain-containing protein, partial [Paracoccaceae bacterium]